MDDQLSYAILYILREHRGPESRIPKGDLLKQVRQYTHTNLSERALRQAIEGLRANHREGAFICSSLEGGYFMARDVTELNEYLCADESRIRQIAQRIRLQRQRAGLEVSGQMSLFGGFRK